MSYLSTDRRRGGISSRLILTALFLVLVLLIIFFSHSFSGLAQLIGRPVWQVRNSITQSSFWSGFSSKVRLAKDNQEELQKIQELEVLALDQEALRHENDELKSILNYKDTVSKRILSSILLYPPSSPYDTLIVNRGEKDGVRVGATVFALGNLAIGAVAEVHSDSATVRLFSSPGEKRQVLVTGPTTTTAALAEGRGGGNFILSLPAGTPVEAGDPVLIPGTPPIILGKIEKTETLPNDSFMTVFFKSPVNIQSLRYLEINK